MGVLIVAALSGMAVPGGSAPGELPAPADSRGGSSQRVVLMEEFTADWCVWCTPAAHSITRLTHEYGHDKVVMLEYHDSRVGSPWDNGPWDDEFWTQSSEDRGNFYSFAGYPTTIVDGGGPYSGTSNNPGQGGYTLWLVGSWGSGKFDNYQYFKQLVDDERSPANNANMTLTLETELTGNQGSVKAIVYATDPIVDQDLVIRFAIYQNNLYHLDGFTNEDYGYHRYYNHVVRQMLPDVIIPASFGEGQTFIGEQSFTLDPTWYAGLDIRDVGVAAFVQKSTRTSFLGDGDVKYNAAVLQAAAHDFTEPYVLLVDDDSTDTMEDGLNRYQASLTKAGIPFKVWDTVVMGESNSMSVRLSPSSAQMAPYPAVVWFTGFDTSTLDGTERASLGTYLDSGGTLFISGEDIGNDAGFGAWLLWFQSYLHATYSGGDDVPASSVDGILGDPISDGMNGLPISPSSPSEIGELMSNRVFTYGGFPTKVGAVRADHGSNSARLTYFAFNYFEGADTSNPLDSSASLIQRILTWLDLAAPPRVDVLQPDGGEVLAGGSLYNVTWDARDVDLPQMPIQIYYTSDYDSPVPTWTLLSSGEPNDGMYKWTVPTGVNSAHCRVKVVATDSQMLQGEDLSNLDFTIGTPPVPFQVVLNPGMNLISFPKIPADTTLSTVLSSVDPDYATVRVYDPAAPGDGWLGWARGKVTNDLTDLDNTIGFWIDVTAPAPIILTVDGADPVTTDINLHAGWNLVGYPSSSTTYTVADLKAGTGATSVEGFDATSSPYYLKTLTDAYVLAAGEAYWVYVPSDVIWTVTY